MAQWVALVLLCLHLHLHLHVVLIAARAVPDAPLSFPASLAYAYASRPLEIATKSSAPAFAFRLRPFTNNADTSAAQTPAGANPTFLVASPNLNYPASNLVSFSPAPAPAPAQAQAQRVFASPFQLQLQLQQAPPGAVVQFVEADGSPPSNFVTITRGPQQQRYVPSQPSPNEPRDFGRIFVSVPSSQPTEQQTNQSPAVFPRQFGMPTVFSSRATSGNLQPAEPAPVGNTASFPQPPQGRTVVVISPRKAGLQSPGNEPERRRVRPSTPQQPQPRRVFLATPNPNQVAEQPANSFPVGGAPNNPSANLVSSTQFFSRNFGNTGTVTYFVRPLSAPASNEIQSQRSTDAET